MTVNDLKNEFMFVKLQTPGEISFHPSWVKAERLVLDEKVIIQWIGYPIHNQGLLIDRNSRALVGAVFFSPTEWESEVEECLRPVDPSAYQFAMYPDEMACAYHYESFEYIRSLGKQPPPINKTAKNLEILWGISDDYEYQVESIDFTCMTFFFVVDKATESPIALFGLLFKNIQRCCEGYNTHLPPVEMYRFPVANVSVP